jgi:hypothetical protein
MPIVPFDALPDSARIWIFGSDRALDCQTIELLMATVDRYLSEWKAHGVPLRSGRDWREDRFLTIGVDVTAENASGCSIDGLFRALRQIEQSTGARLVGGGRIFLRARDGSITVVSREEFVDQARRGVVTGETPVFDLSLATLGDFRQRFERRAWEGWTARLL